MGRHGFEISSRDCAASEGGCWPPKWLGGRGFRSRGKESSSARGRAARCCSSSGHRATAPLWRMRELPTAAPGEPSIWPSCAGLKYDSYGCLAATAAANWHIATAAYDSSSPTICFAICCTVCGVAVCDTRRGLASAPIHRAAQTVPV